MGGLQNLRILVTRPIPLAFKLLDEIRERGWVPLFFPGIEVVATEDTPYNIRLAQQLENYDFLFFFSRIAVRFAFALFARLEVYGPPGTVLGAVGRHTACELETMGWPCSMFPDKAGSMSLITIPAIRQMSAGKIAIFKGHGGNMAAIDALRNRGFDVHCAEIYRRQLPPIEVAFGERTPIPDVILVSSVDILKNLVACTRIESLWCLLNMSLILGSESMLSTCRQLGFLRTVVAESPGDADMLHATECWARTYSRPGII